MNQMLGQINFYGDTLTVARDVNGVVWVAAKSICDALGVAWQRQHEKLRENPQFSCHHMMIVGADSKQREMVCIPLQNLTVWLCNINANRVAPQARDKLLRYQAECQAVLTNYFFPQGGTGHELAAFAARFDMRFTEVQKQFTEVQTKLNQIEHVSRGLRDEVDELKAVLGILVSDNAEVEARALVKEIKEKLGMDGRTIVGQVRKTLGLSGIYNTPDIRKVNNVLKVMLGRGLTSVP